MLATARRTSGLRASTDQVSACRKLAKVRSLTISDERIYADQAQSGARSDRPALAALMAGARSGEFDVVLVDDLSRLAHDNHLMLSIIAELHFEGIRVISVATASTAPTKSRRSPSRSEGSSTSFSCAT